MSHHHDHHHHHDHGDHKHDHHSHDHTHGHKESPMPFDEQLRTLFSHWIKHNDSHAGTYAEWAKKARDHGMEDTAALLDEIAAMTAELNKKIEQAAKTVEK